MGCRGLKGGLPAPACCELSPLPNSPHQSRSQVRSFPARGEGTLFWTRSRHSSLRTSQPMHPFRRLESRPSGSRGWTPGRLDAEAPFRRSPAGRRTLDCPFTRMTPNSLEHHPDPSEAPTGRAWGRAAGGNDRASGLWVAGAKEAGGIGYFWPWLAYRPAARVRRASQSHLCPPSRIPRRGRGETRVGGPGGRGDVPAHLRPPPTTVQSGLHRSGLGPETAGAVTAHVCPAAPGSRRALLFPQRSRSGMDSGRDFLTLHGECRAGARGVPAWVYPAESRSLVWAEDPQLLHPPSASPRPGPALRPFCRIGEISAQD